MLRPALLSRLAVLVLATSAFALLASAATETPAPGVVELISQAELIVAGRVVRVSDGFTATGTPYTEVTLAVDECPKGDLRRNRDYRFRQYGLVAPRKLYDGRIVRTVSPEGFPRWHEGERVFAFLGPAAPRTGLQTTVGLAHGKFVLLDGRLANEFDNAGLFDGVQVNDSLLRSDERAMLHSSGPVDADAFVGFVRRAVRDDWVASGALR